MKPKKTKKVQKIESLPSQVEVTAPTTSLDQKKIVIGSFSGDFGREDFNALRDKVNEIIDFINK